MNLHVHDVPNGATAALGNGNLSHLLTVGHIALEFRTRIIHPLFDELVGKVSCHQRLEYAMLTVLNSDLGFVELKCALKRSFLHD